MISSYSHIVSLGHAALGRQLFAGQVIVEEKVDGSQFSFAAVPTDEGDTVGNRLVARSRGAEIHVDHPDSLFKGAVETARDLHQRGMLQMGWVYRGECVSKPKHNVLAYGRVPQGNVVIFDISTGLETYLSRDDKVKECERIGLECVPLLGVIGEVPTADGLRMFLDMESVLGGCKIEGIVMKPALYDVFGRDGKVVMAKWVSAAFKEKHQVEWKNANPGQRDIVERLAVAYGCEGRWRKGVQHMREAGTLVGEPRDIGGLIREVQKDIEAEDKQEIMSALWKWAWPQISRGCVRGLAEWYKGELMKELTNDKICWRSEYCGQG